MNHPAKTKAQKKSRARLTRRTATRALQSYRLGDLDPVVDLPAMGSLKLS